MSSREAAWEATELLTGALRKVAMARYHARELGRTLEDTPPFEIALQAHFEGVLYSGVSAEEKLALAISTLTGSGAGADTARLVRDLRARPETDELGRQLARWLQARDGDTTLAEEARALRNAATHRFYDKRGGPRGEWHYEVETRRGHFRSGFVVEFADAYTRHIEELQRIAEAVGERWELPLEPTPVEA